jgi:predicted hydrocarbon binding protein
MANPAFVLERLAEFWGRYQDSGVWTVVRTPPNRVQATLEGWGSEDEATCVRLAAYTKRLFELVGAKDVYVDRRACRARGDAACVFVGGWT